jgi:hypothetical protein
MPYRIEKQGSKYCVVKQDGGASMGCSDSEDEAKKHMSALYANENKAMTINERLEAKALSQPVANMQPDPPVPGCVGETSARYEAAGMPPALALSRAEQDCVEAAETGIEADAPEVKALVNGCYEKALVKYRQTGISEADAESKAKAECSDSTPPVGYDKAHSPDVAGKALFDRIWERIQARLGTKDDLQTSFKVTSDGHFLAVWSNDFADRDKEIFTRKAIDDYVARVDMGVVPKPELWVWHVPGTRIGQADFVARQGHFLIAGGTFDDTEAAQQAKAFYAKNADKTADSHGFAYEASTFDGKHYHRFNSFEISLLPRGVEANLFTSLEGVKAMAVDERKKKYLDKVFGADVADHILANLDERGKALEELDVEFKDFVETSESTDEKAADEAQTTAFKDLLPDVIEGSAEAVKAALEAVKAVNGLKADVAEMRQKLAMRPRGSQSDRTLVTEQEAKDLGVNTEETYFDPVLKLQLKRNIFAQEGGS